MFLRYPVNYIAITSAFTDNHKGLDLGWHTNPNEKIYAAGSGEVIFVRSDCNYTDNTKADYGNYIKIRHSNGVVTLYAHLKYQSINVEVGDIVEKGDYIALMGNTGNSYGNHLHYEVIIDDKRLDPTLYTYVYKDQTVSSDDIDKVLYYKEESEDINILKKRIEELEEENIKLKEELNNYNFKYEAVKSGYYKIKLCSGETLLIKN